ncbi:hypothetical protein CJ030_MR4G027351 [Morella rubra]|uniref:Bulb-type lectin domain-containing protein n=1 Tax=Morella rubra TaxID=262757 RepID=A0A6A1VUQ2_9ROSI|nr:hypothetical protein CJ030_MR4G027351 [Morella rubra]
MAPVHSIRRRYLTHLQAWNEVTKHRLSNNPSVGWQVEDWVAVTLVFYHPILDFRNAKQLSCSGSSMPHDQWVKFRSQFLYSEQASYGVDSITQTQSLIDGKTLVSKEGSFELGFFRPGSSTNRYLGICQNKKVIWSTSPPRQQSQNLLLQLLDSGNLVLRDERSDNPEDYVWQSFDYPSDTLLPGMKHGWDLRRGLNRRLTSWRNWEDPSPGDFTFEIQLHNYPEGYIWKGSKIFFRSGPWNGIGTSGSPSLKQNSIYQFTFVTNEDEVYFLYTLKNKSVITRVVINQSDTPFERFTWVDTEKIWNLYSTLPKDLCDSYALCGAYGNCIISDSPVCQCLKGFRPKSEEKWDLTDWTQGCVPRNR